MFVFKNTYYTSLMSFELKDPTVKPGLGIDGSRINATKYHDADDLAILYNEYCASTCFIADDIFSLNCGVKSVVLGGQPARELSRASSILLLRGIDGCDNL